MVWFDDETHEEYIKIYHNIVDETRNSAVEEDGEDILSNPNRIWEIAQSVPSYRENDVEDILKLSDAIYEEFRQEIDWSACVRRIKQYEVPSGSHIGDYLPTGYARRAGEEVILHAVTYKITGKGRS